VGRVFVGPAAAVMVDSIGWPAFYFSTVFIAIPGLILLYVMRDKLKQY
jgi:PAT family beta-lactamase induction signal transducer AmpG